MYSLCEIRSSHGGEVNEVLLYLQVHVRVYTASHQYIFGHLSYLLYLTVSNYRYQLISQFLPTTWLADPSYARINRNLLCYSLRMSDSFLNLFDTWQCLLLEFHPLSQLNCTFNSWPVKKLLKNKLTWIWKGKLPRKKTIQKTLKGQRNYRDLNWLPIIIQQRHSV